MAIGELEAYVEDMSYNREELRLRIADRGAQRRQFLAEQPDGDGLETSASFDVAVRTAIRKQAEQKGFYFPERRRRILISVKLVSPLGVRCRARATPSLD